MNIYLGNLNYRVQEEDLQKRLEEYGTVDSVRIIKDRESGRSRGYAFAEMPNDEEANRVIAELNDQTFEGRRLIAKVALPRPGRFPHCGSMRSATLTIVGRRSAP